MPWACLCACLVILGVEGALRLVDLERLSPYAWGLREYDASALRLRAEGPPEILVLGTSRTREALDLPYLRASLQRGLGRTPSLGSHALSGARAGEARAILDLALRHGHPRLVLLGLDPRLLQGTHEHTDRQARFAALSATWDRSRSTADRRLTAHAHLGSILRAYGCRRRLGAALLGTDDLHPQETPLLGGASLFQQATPDKSLLSHPAEDAWIEAALDRVRERGAYRMTAQRLRTVREIVQMCRTAQIPLLMFEVPLSRAMQWHLPMGTMEAFERIATELAREHATPYVSTAELGLVLGPEDFLEPSHLGRRGARALTEALAERVLIPEYGALLAKASGD